MARPAFALLLAALGSSAALAAAAPDAPGPFLVVLGTALLDSVDRSMSRNSHSISHK
jgi:hypothetical protein